MGSNSLKLYPSGFLGNGETGHLQPINIQAIKRHLFDHAPLGALEASIVNRDVESLWDDVVFGDATYKTFEFREKIIKVALRAFGTRSIFEWISAQSDSGQCTEYNRRWIDETLQFVLEGRARSFAYSAWFTMFACGSAEDVSPVTPTVRRHFGTDGFRDISINDFIVLWVSQPRGVDDLIESLHILFGNR